MKEEGCEVVYHPRTPEISSSQIKEDLHTKENKMIKKTGRGIKPRSVPLMSKSDSPFLPTL